MNWKNGLFRTWVLISVLWLILIAFRAYNEFSVPHLFSGNFQYVIQLIEASEKQPDFSKGFYEIANAPGKGRYPDEFVPLEDQDATQWNKDKAIHIIEMPDGSNLYLIDDLTTQDKTYLAKLFWDRRRTRYLRKVWPHIAVAFGPPAALLALGTAIFWVGRGFKKPA